MRLTLGEIIWGNLTERQRGVLIWLFFEKKEEDYSLRLCTAFCERDDNPFYCPENLLGLIEASLTSKPIANKTIMEAVGSKPIDVDIFVWILQNLQTTISDRCSTSVEEHKQK